MDYEYNNKQYCPFKFLTTLNCVIDQLAYTTKVVTHLQIKHVLKILIMIKRISTHNNKRQTKIREYEPKH